MPAAWPCGRRRYCAARLGAEADLLGERRAVARVVRRHHRIIGRQAPALAILLGGHVVGGLEMALQHLELLAVFETDDVVGENRFLDRNGGLRLLGLARLASNAGQRPEHVLDQAGQRVGIDRIVGDMRRNDLRSQPQNIGVCRVIGHLGPFERTTCAIYSELPAVSQWTCRFRRS